MPWSILCSFATIKYLGDRLGVGCVTFQGVGVLPPVEGNINSEKYINILDTYLWPVVAKNFGNSHWILQEDKCPVHVPVSRQACHWETENNSIETIPWPAQ